MFFIQTLVQTLVQTLPRNLQEPIESVNCVKELNSNSSKWRTHQIERRDKPSEDLWKSLTSFTEFIRFNGMGSNEIGSNGFCRWRSPSNSMLSASIGRCSSIAYRATFICSNTRFPWKTPKCWNLRRELDWRPPSKRFNHSATSIEALQLRQLVVYYPVEATMKLK